MLPELPESEYRRLLEFIAGNERQIGSAQDLHDRFMLSLALKQVTDRQRPN